jgi:two-component system, NarL family, nitrate/nitrite response regulator NarL
VSLRCLIVDDNRSFLDSARFLLVREGLVVAGVASTVADALRQVEAVRPDVVLVDISLGEESGFDLARRLAVSEAGAPVVVLVSLSAEADYADLIAASPAAGFIPKAELSAAAIRSIAGQTG